MTPKEIQVLYRACKSAGIDASKIQPLHQFSLLLCSSQHQLLLQTLGMMDFLGSQKQREQYLAQGNKSQQKSFMIAFVVLNFARQKEILIPSLGETSCRNR